MHARQDADTANVADEIVSADHHDEFCVSSLFDDAALINYTTQHFEQQQKTIEFSQNENEEEELSVHSHLLIKKTAALYNSFLSSYYSQTPAHLYQGLTKSHPSGRPFHSLSSRQYIVFRVIRI